jgi:hypothetical protein
VVKPRGDWDEITDVRSWGAAESWIVREIVIQITSIRHSFQRIRQNKIPMLNLVKPSKLWNAY